MRAIAIVLRLTNAPARSHHDSLRRENAAMFDALERKTRCLEQASACLSTHNALQKERTSLHQSLAFTTQKLNDAEARLTTCESQIERSKASAQTQENLLAELDAQHRRANSCVVAEVAMRNSCGNWKRTTSVSLRLWRKKPKCEWRRSNARRSGSSALVVTIEW
eukprot:GEMP01104118.1.p1 GENE.GEMP01104118.1~~GEMP01104118.1.p1  ORF type:complete len:165 (+),score=43.31 GEMP01104118.1:146-640(+)